MSTRVTVLQIFKFALTALIIGLLPNPLHARDKTYIEVEINGETVGKWMEFYEHREYNPDGKVVYRKMSGYWWTKYLLGMDHRNKEIPYEEWYKYDRNGNCIYEKDSEGDETWYEYDRNGNCIYEKNSDGDETWYEYDRNGNCIHRKSSDGSEYRCEYDRNGNLIHAKFSNGYETWYEYDRNGNCIYEKDSKGVELWLEHDRNGNCIHRKSSDGSEYWRENDTHGNIIREFWKSKDGTAYGYVYILEYYRGSTTVKTETAYHYEQ